MNQKKKILVINKKQFGYHTDIYKCCQYNTDLLEITLICFDSGYKKIKSNKINVIYLSNKGTSLIRGIRFIYKSIKESRVGHYDIIFMIYFPMVSIIKIFINSLTILSLTNLPSFILLFICWPISEFILISSLKISPVET